MAYFDCRRAYVSEEAANCCKDMEIFIGRADKKGKFASLKFCIIIDVVQLRKSRPYE